MRKVNKNQAFHRWISLRRNKLFIAKRWLEKNLEKKSSNYSECFYAREERIYPSYIAKYNSQREK